MTIQKRTLIEPRDIVGIEYECRHCQSRYVVPLARFDREISHCPNCKEAWISTARKTGQEQSDEQAFSLFVKYLMRFQGGEEGVIVRLELADGVEAE